MGNFKWYQVIYGIFVGFGMIALLTFCIMEMYREESKPTQAPFYRMSRLEINILLIFVFIAIILSYVFSWVDGFDAGKQEGQKHGYLVASIDYGMRNLNEQWIRDTNKPYEKLRQHFNHQYDDEIYESLHGKLRTSTK